MTIGIGRVNGTSALHRPPIADGFALRSQNWVSATVIHCSIVVEAGNLARAFPCIRRRKGNS
jgi:hypothetical protein